MDLHTFVLGFAAGGFTTAWALVLTQLLRVTRREPAE